MEAKIDKVRSSTSRFSLKGMRKNSYSVLDEDPGSRTRSEIEDIDNSEQNTNDRGSQSNAPCQQVDSIMHEDKQAIECGEQIPRKNKRKFSLGLLKKKREHVSTEFLVIEENRDTNNELVKNKHKKKSKKKSSKKYEKDCSLTKEEKRTKKKKRTKRMKKAGRRAAKAISEGFLQLGAAFRYMSPIATMPDVNRINTQHYYNVADNTHNTSYL